MNTPARLWLLGADDPEKTVIETILRECGENVAHAVGPDGQRVHPGSAYKCAPVDGGTHYVECSPATGLPTGAVSIDHHRPGDPGYGKPAEEFLPASSIGQVLLELVRLDVALPFPARLLYSRAAGFVFHAGAWSLDYDHLTQEESWCYDLPDEIVLAAASDHCLAAAYRGECPGVDPDALMAWRCRTRAAHQQRSESDLLADVERARTWLSTAPRADGVIDARDLTIPELPEAAVREGVAYLATVTDKDGRIKDVLAGHTTPELVAQWMEQARSEGREVYGDPARGFAGAYRS